MILLCIGVISNIFTDNDSNINSGKNITDDI